MFHLDEISISGIIDIGNWDNSNIHIFHANTMAAFNQLVGYIKHNYAGLGTVLYRGQCDLYQDLTPSIFHNAQSFIKNENLLNKTIEDINSDIPLAKFFGFQNPKIKGWKLYKDIVIEATLQHYGARTFCLDFVDNHWTALWFGLYRWNNLKNKYLIRRISEKSKDQFIDFNEGYKEKLLPPEPTYENIALSVKTINFLDRYLLNNSINKDELIEKFKKSALIKLHKRWEKEYSKIDSYNEKFRVREKAPHLYIIPYVAKTDVPSINGLYIAENEYTVDLRRALPSFFLRPCAQHGWIVRGKENLYAHKSNVPCIIRINVALAKEMLGNGALLSQENFFPTEKIDQGYRILLKRQQESRYVSNYPKIIPPDMVHDYYRNI